MRLHALLPRRSVTDRPTHETILGTTPAARLTTIAIMPNQRPTKDSRGSAPYPAAATSPATIRRCPSGVSSNNAPSTSIPANAPSTVRPCTPTRNFAPIG